MNVRNANQKIFFIDEKQMNIGVADVAKNGEKKMPKGIYKHTKEHNKKISFSNLGKHFGKHKEHKISNEIREKMKKNITGEKNPRWNGGKSICSRGYVYLLKKEHPFADCDGYVAEHRLVMEKHLGRYLESCEEPHHINGNKSDNRIENLRLYKNRAEHMRFERTGKKYSVATKLKMSLAKKGIKNPNYKNGRLSKSIKISTDLYQKIKKIAKEDRRNLKAVLELAILNYMKKRIMEK